MENEKTRHCGRVFLQSRDERAQDRPGRVDSGRRAREVMPDARRAPERPLGFAAVHNMPDMLTAGLAARNRPLSLDPVSLLSVWQMLPDGV